MTDIRGKLTGKVSKLAKTGHKEAEHPARLNNYQNGSFYHVEIDLINPDPDQPRKYFNPTSLAELSQSIKQNGILQPVIIRKEQDKIYLVAGERRYRAAKMAGLQQIPAILTTGKPTEIALIENLQRENLKPIEEAEALGRMLEEYSYTQEQLAFVIGKARTTITETLSLNKLPEAVKAECRRADIYPRRLLVEVVKQKTPKAMISLFNQIKEGNLKSGQVRNITRKRKGKQKPLTMITLNKAHSLVNSLNKLDLNTMAGDEKNQLMTVLQDLKKTIDEIIS